MTKPRRIPTKLALRGAGAASAAMLLLTGCGADESTPVLTWYINPDAVSYTHLTLPTNREV